MELPHPVSLPLLDQLFRHISRQRRYQFVLMLVLTLASSIAEVVSLGAVLPFIGIHCIPNHLQPYFKPFATSLPVTEQLGEEILTLPLYYDMTDEQVSVVIEAVSDFFNRE